MIKVAVDFIVILVLTFLVAFTLVRFLDHRGTEKDLIVAIAISVLCLLVDQLVSKIRALVIYARQP